MDHVLHRAWHQHIAIGGNKFVRRDHRVALLARGRDDGLAVSLGSQQQVEIEAICAIDCTGRIRHGNDLVAIACHQRAHELAGIAEALNGDAKLRSKAQIMREVANEIETTACGRIVTAQRTAKRQRLAGNNGGR